jgi:hypothetical protein
VKTSFGARKGLTSPYSVTRHIPDRHQGGGRTAERYTKGFKGFGYQVAPAISWNPMGVSSENQKGWGQGGKNKTDKQDRLIGFVVVERRHAFVHRSGRLSSQGQGEAQHPKYRLGLQQSSDLSLSQTPFPGPPHPWKTWSRRVSFQCLSPGGRKQRSFLLLLLLQVFLLLHSSPPHPFLLTPVLP